MRVIMRPESASIGEFDDLLEPLGQAGEIIRPQPVRALRSSADDQMFRPEPGGGVSDPTNSREFLFEDVWEDEIRARVGGEELDAGARKASPECRGVVLVIEQIAVEQFDTVVTGFAYLRYRAAHVAKGAIGELCDRGDADRVAA